MTFSTEMKETMGEKTTWETQPFQVSKEKRSQGILQSQNNNAHDNGSETDANISGQNRGARVKSMKRYLIFHSLLFGEKTASSSNGSGN